MRSLPAITDTAPGAAHRAVIATAGATAALVTALVVGYVAIYDHTHAVMLMLASLVVVAFVMSFSAPGPIFAMSVVLIVLVPLTSAPTHSAVIAHPGLLLMGVLVAALLSQRLLGAPAFGISAVDVAVVVFFVILLIPVLYGIRDPVEYGRLIFLWMVPALAGRLAVMRVGVVGLARPLVVAGLLLVPFAVGEVASGTNLFLALPRAGGATDFLQSVSRLGGHRAQASFGHPIALAMYLSTVSVLAMGLAAVAHGRARTAWIVASVVLAVAQATTLSRTGLGIIVIGMAIIVAFQLRRTLTRRRLWTGIAVVAAAGALLAFGPSGQVVRGSGDRTGQAEIAHSADYRLELVRLALKPGTLNSLGRKHGLVGPDGNPSIDNEYLYLVGRWGLLALVAFVLVPVAVLCQLRGGRERTLTLAVAAAVLGNFFALGSVALITQQQVYIWLLVGMASGAVMLARRPELAPPASR